MPLYRVFGIAGSDIADNPVSPQLSFDFGEEFQSLKKYSNEFSDWNGREDVCPICDSIQALGKILPFFEGEPSPYSDFWQHVCSKCYKKHDGDEIIAMSNRRFDIQK